MLARARQVAPQSYATLTSTAGTRLAALLSLRYRYVWCSLRACQLVFSSKRSLSRHPRLLLPPNPSRFRLRSIVLNWGQPPLIVRLACGSRGRRSVTALIALRYIPCSLPAALAPLATASPYTSAAGKALRYRYAAFPPPRCSRLFSLALGKEV